MKVQKNTTHDTENHFRWQRVKSEAIWDWIASQRVDHKRWCLLANLFPFRYSVEHWWISTAFANTKKSILILTQFVVNIFFLWRSRKVALWQSFFTTFSSIKNKNTQQYWSTEKCNWREVWRRIFNSHCQNSSSTKSNQHHTSWKKKNEDERVLFNILFFFLSRNRMEVLHNKTSENDKRKLKQFYCQTETETEFDISIGSQKNKKKSSWKTCQTLHETNLTSLNNSPKIIKEKKQHQHEKICSFDCISDGLCFVQKIQQIQLCFFLFFLHSTWFQPKKLSESPQKN